MAKQTVNIIRNSGGQSSSPKEGIENSFAYSQHLDFRKDPNLMTILPETVKESSTTITSLLTNMIQLPSGKIVGIDDSGGVYTRTTGGSWSKHGTTLTDTAVGMVYNLQHDTIYVPGTTAVHSITGADGRFGGSLTPTSSTFTKQVDQSSGNGHANTYTAPTSISEAATALQTFTPALEPLYSIKVWITSKGTGNATLTLHDQANNVLATKTIANASLTSGAYNEFVFTTPARMSAKPNPANYHFHITVDTGTTTVGTATASNLSTSDYETYSNRLVSPTNGFHPAYEFLQYILILNERYVAAWEPISQSAPDSAEFNQHRLTFPSGYEGTSGAIWTEYFAVGVEKRSSSATNEFQEGKIFFWDGISTTYNFIIDVPEGAPYSLFSHKNILYWFAGGGWWAWSGGQPVKLFQMPNTESEFTDVATYVVVNPHMMTVKDGVLLGAYPTLTSSTTIEHMIYSYGSLNRLYPNSFGQSYSISTGNTTNGTLRLGMVKNLGDKLFVSWRDNTAYGVDKVSPSSDPFGTATWQSLIMDNGRPDKQKEAVHMEITFKTLPSGATVTPKYDIDRSGSFTSGTAATAGDTKIRFNINKRYKEIQLAYDLVATTATPEIISVNLVYEDNVSEAD